MSDLAVTGYTLSMDDGWNGAFKPVYIGTNRPDLHTYQVGSLTPGLSYRFYVQAMNVNGLSAPSVVTTLYAC